MSTLPNKFDATQDSAIDSKVTAGGQSGAVTVGSTDANIVVIANNTPVLTGDVTGSLRTTIKDSGEDIFLEAIENIRLINTNGDTSISADSGFNVQNTAGTVNRLVVNATQITTAIPSYEAGMASNSLATKQYVDNTTGALTYALNDLTDVTITTPANRQYVMYNGGTWINQTFAMGGIYSNTPITIPATGDITQNTYTLMNPTTTSTTLMEFTTPSNGRLTYTGTVSKHFHIVCQISALSNSGNDRQWSFRLYKNGAALDPILQVNLHGTRYNGVALHADTTMATNDYLELYGTPTGGNESIVVSNLYLFCVGM